jgi:hypothetical protein
MAFMGNLHRHEMPKERPRSGSRRPEKKQITAPARMAKRIGRGLPDPSPGAFKETLSWLSGNPAERSRRLGPDLDGGWRQRVPGVFETGR